MKKLTVILITLMLMCSIFAGCGGKTGTSGNEAQPSQTASKPEATGSTLSLNKIKQAAKDAGYTITDEYQAAFLDDVSAGFTVKIVADDQDIRYSILECGSEGSAIKNAKTINDAGHNIAIIRGKILSFYNVNNKNGTGKDILTSIVEGKPVKSK